MINLGDKVRDLVSGFTGIAVSRHEYLQGCARINVQPKIDEDGKLPKDETFDEPQLEVIERQVVLSEIDKSLLEFETGGPERHMPKRRR